MQINVKIRSGARARAQRAIRELDLVGPRIVSIVEQGAQRLVSDDPYQDRTGLLRSNTEAFVDEVGDPTIVVLMMNTEYASFVNARGFSHFDEVVEDVKDQIADGLRAVRQRISGR